MRRFILVIILFGFLVGCGPRFTFTVKSVEPIEGLISVSGKAYYLLVRTEDGKNYKTTLDNRFYFLKGGKYSAVFDFDDNLVSIKEVK